MKKAFRLEVLLAVVLAATVATVVPSATAADAANVNGVWDLSVETPNGTGTPTVTFKQDGENLSGTYKGRRGETALKGTIKGNDIKFTITVNIQGQDLVIEYSGTVDGNTMKGKAKFGDAAEGNFTGKKQAEDTPAQK